MLCKKTISLLNNNGMILKFTNNIAEYCEFLHYLNLNLVTVCIYFCIEITEFVMSLLTIINNNYVTSK